MSKKNTEFYQKYCIGCGLCQSCDIARIEVNKNGFIQPNPKEKESFNKFCSEFCTASGRHSGDLSKNHIWGKFEKNGVFLAWSADDEVRHEASSGGVLTSLAGFLLENKLVDGIIHIGIKENSVLETCAYCSITKEEVALRSGSRYIISSVLKDLEQYLQGEQTYALIGRPCDIAVLRNYAKQDYRVDEKIKYMFSFFCAGAPSLVVNQKLLTAMGTNKDECISLKYRGNGWPGEATAIDKRGKEYKMSYEESWGRILGRDVYPMCRFCIDGIGELADISCGDAWYLTDAGQPNFTENKGRNVVFCRTEKGFDIFKKACEKGDVISERFENFEEELPRMQKYQFDRRTTMKSMLSAMKLFAKPVPSYNKKALGYYSKNANKKLKIKRFFGIIKRNLKGKI